MLSHYHILGAEDWGMRGNNLLFPGMSWNSQRQCGGLSVYRPAIAFVSPVEITFRRFLIWNVIVSCIAVLWPVLIKGSWMGSTLLLLKFHFVKEKNTDVKTSFLFKMKRIARGNRRVLVKFDNNLSYMYFWARIIVFTSFLKTVV